jgi:hypothetical protein
LLKVITTPIKHPQVSKSTKKDASPATVPKKEKAKKTPEPRMKTPERNANMSPKEKETKSTRGKRSEKVAPLALPVPVAEPKKRKTPEKAVAKAEQPVVLRSPTVTRVAEQKMYSSPELNTMSRLEVQRIARTLNIATNQKTDILIELIADQVHILLSAAIVCLFVCLFVACVCVFICLFVCLFVCVSLSIERGNCLCLFVCLFVCGVCLCVYLLVCLLFHHYLNYWFAYC